MELLLFCLQFVFFDLNIIYYDINIYWLYIDKSKFCRLLIVIVDVDNEYVIFKKSQKIYFYYIEENGIFLCDSVLFLYF